MKKIYFGIFLVLLLGLFLINYKERNVDAVSGNNMDLYIFYGNGCPHCSKMLTFLEQLKEKYPSLNVKEYEIYFNQENRELFEKMAESFGTKIEGVPTIFIDDKVIVGFTNELAESVEQEIKRCLIQNCTSPVDKIKGEVTHIIGESSPLENPEKTKLKQTITIPVVIGAAAVDAINPCAFAVLILLLTSVLASGSKKRALFAGLAFTLAIYTSYLLMGIGLYSAVSIAGLTHRLYSIVAVLAILIGLFNLKDYLWYGRWFIMEVPISWRPRMKLLIKGVSSVPGAFLIGITVSLFLLPCTSGPYIVILGLLAKTATRNFAFLLLLLYNFIFIIPMLLITFAIYFGFTTTEQAEQWRTRKLKVLHLIAGIIILTLGIGMIIALWLGLL